MTRRRLQERPRHARAVHVSPLAHFDKYVKRYGDLLNDRGLLVLDMNDSMNTVSQSGCGGGACG